MNGKTTKDSFGLYLSIAAGAVIGIGIFKTIGIGGAIGGGLGALVGAIGGSAIYKLIRTKG